MAISSVPASKARSPLNCGTASTTLRVRPMRARSRSMLPLRSPENETMAWGREQYSSRVSGPGRLSPRKTLQGMSRSFLRLALAGRSVV
ncbi:hypothetical protein D3C84_954000 [compost metagenome]